SPNKSATRLYFGPKIGVAKEALAHGSDSQGSAGVNLGITIPIITRMAFRLEVGGSRWFKSYIRPAFHRISVSLGLSFFTK
ncbi:MAG: hypothetical protein V3T31_13420, partial [candidate division Zixibacteria bacterium]